MIKFLTDVVLDELQREEAGSYPGETGDLRIWKPGSNRRSGF